MVIYRYHRRFNILVSLCASLILISLPIIVSAALPSSILKRKDDFVEQEEVQAPKKEMQRIFKQRSPKKQQKQKPFSIIEALTGSRPAEKKQPLNLNQFIADEIENADAIIKPTHMASVVAKIEQNLSRTTLSFLWEYPVKASVFINRQKLWIIFDQNTTIQFVDQAQQFVTNNLQNNIRLTNIKQYKLNNNQTFIVADIKSQDATSKIPLSAYKNGEAWVVEISNATQTTKPIRVMTRADQDLNMFVEVITGELTHDFIHYEDPFTRRMMTAIPLEHDRVRMRSYKSFVDFNVLQTAQGAVIEHSADNLIIQASSMKSFSVEGADGLNAAPDIEIAQHGDATDILMHSSKEALINVADFKVNPKNFIQKENELKGNIISAKPSFKSRARIALAMFYMANSFYTEAKSVLSFAKQEDSTLEHKYQIITLTAALEFFTRHHAEAMSAMQQLNIEDVPSIHKDEVRFWQSIASYNANDSYQYVALSNALKVFTSAHNNFLKYYTNQMLNAIGFSIFEYKIKKDSLENAYQILNTLLKLGQLDSNLVNRLNYDMGKFYVAKQEDDKALQYLNKCMIDDSDALHYNRCAYYRGMLLRKMHKIEDAELIEILERIRMSWRGDKFEMQVLQSLYDLYANNSRVIDSIRIGQVVLDNYPTTLEALHMTNDMSKTFIKFFLYDNKKEDPIQALEIFFEFQHLLPVGYLGDEIILRVAEYLAQLDLLDRYIILLDHQVKNRLVGFKRERAINKLATAYLQNMQPENAIRTTRLGSNTMKLPQSMEDERKYIKAEAYYNMGKLPDVLNVLKDDYSHKADELKGYVFWEQQNWRAFNDVSEPYIYSIRNDNNMLNSAQVVRLLKQAISYLNIQEHILLETMYEDFKSRLPAGNRYTELMALLVNMSHAHRLKTNGDIEDAKQLYDLTTQIIESLNNTKM